MRLLFPTLPRFSVVATVAPFALAVAFAIGVGSGMVGCSQGTVALPIYDGGSVSDVTAVDSESDAQSEAGADGSEGNDGGARDASVDAPGDGSTQGSKDGSTDGSADSGAATTDGATDANDHGG